MKKTIYLLFLMFAGLLIHQSAYSMPAKPGLIEFRQPDGTSLNIYLYGDEKIKWATTEDGYTLLFNAEGFYEYAVMDSRSDMVPSGIMAKNSEQRSKSDVSFLSTVSKNLYYSNEQVSYLQQIWNIYDSEAKNGEKAFTNAIGNKKLLCILIGYSDRPFVKTQAEFTALFNQVGYSVGGATGSVKDYYLENSWNQFNLTVDVAGPYTAANTLSYYGTNDGSGNDLYPRTLVTEAVNLADPDVNYADYDNDGGGSVDGLYVIYAGYGEESGAPANTIWAHAWTIPTVTKDGKTISSYSCSSELRGTTGTNITRIGVICHEFGHVLGADDFYDTDYATGGQYDGTGEWDLMGGGGWNNSGATPAHHNPYTKIIVYGWAGVITLSSAQNVALLNSEQNSSSFYKYTTTSTNEYFLLENRQQIGFDTYLPGHGMLIYHVDGNYVSANPYDINATSHQGMYPMAANSTTATGIMTSTSTIGTSGCPWPGTSAKTTFTDATTPNAKSWAAANTVKPLLNITEASGIIQFCYLSCPPACTPPTTQASGVNITAIGDNQMQVNWTRGNGTSVLVVAREGSPVDANPFNGINYTADAAFASGMELGTGNYAVYKGTANNVTVTGLTPGTLYYYSVYEFFTADNCFLLPGVNANALTTGIVPSYCDTLSQFCCTPTIYTSANGYVGGTNEYDCLGVAEYFADPTPYNQVTGARIYLAAANNGTSPNVTFVLWDNANGGPTNQMATAVIPMATVVTAYTNDGYIDIDFGGTFDVPPGGFSVGFLVPGTPASGDTLAIVTNSDGEGGDTGYCLFGTSWASYNGSGWGIVLQNAVFPFTCFQNDLPPIAGFIATPARVPMGGSVQFTDISAGTAPTSWSWTFSGGTPATSTSVNPVVSYSTVGFYDVSLTVTNANGTDIETKVGYIEVFDPNGITAFDLDFEPCVDFVLDNFTPWTTYDGDATACWGVAGFDFPNEGYTGSLIAFNSTATTPPATGWEAHGGERCGAFFAANGAVNNDWLITDHITLGTGSSITFWAKSASATYPTERFNVKISTTTNAVASFTTNLSGTITTTTTWTQYTYSLAAYDGDPVYIAIQCVSNDQFALLIDDIEINSTYVTPVCDFSADQTNVPIGTTVNFTDLSTQMPTSWDWSFTGGTPSTSNSQNPSIVYSTIGTYPVTLTVTNSAGTDTETKTGYITVTPIPDVIVEWNFPLVTDNNVADAGLAVNLTKTITAFGGVNDILYTAAGVTTRCVGAETWATGSGTKGWQVLFNTVGYGTLKLSYAQMSDNATSPRDFKIQYSTNGTVWTDLGHTITLVEDVWKTGTNLVLPAACENQANLYIRWIMTSNTGCGGAAVVNTSNTRRNYMDNIVVTGLPLSTPPIANFSANDVTPCVGQSVTFTDATTNTPTSWSWTFTGGTPATSTSQNPVVTYAAAGTYQVALTATNASGSDTETKVGYITVSANPTISATNAGPYCAGQTIVFNATGSGGTSYSWTGPVSFTSAIEDPTRPSALTTHSGTYTVVLTNTTSGCTASATTDVTVNANPTISAGNGGPYCAGATISLTATGAGGNTFAWTGPNAYSTSTEDPSIANGQTINAGTYTVVYTNTTSGCTASANTVVAVNAVPTIAPVNGGPYCSGQTITLTSNGVGGTGYSWTGPNGFTSTASNPTIANGQVVNGGTYNVTITNTTSGCTAVGSTTVVVNASPTVSAINTGPYCAGQTITLNATGSGGTGYAWTGPLAFSSAVEDPTRASSLTTHSGIYTVVLTNTTSGCTATANTTVTVNTLPTISATNTGPYCAGQTITLNATGSGGTGYAWTGPLAFTSAVEDPTRASSLTTHSGTYTVVLTNTTSGCTASATTDVTVNAVPTVSAVNTGPYCAGQTITLNATGSGGTGYAWTGPLAFTSAVEDPTRASSLTTHSGSYVVVLTNTTTGCTATANTSVTVNANPTLSAANTGPYCSGQTISLNATGAGGTDYAWTGPLAFTSAVEDPTRASSLTTHSGSYVVVLTNTTTGCTATANTTVTVNLSPTVSAVNSGPHCAGVTLTLDATGTGGNTYSWTGPNSFTSSIEDPTITNSQAVNSGTYTVVYTNTTSGCTASATTAAVVNANPTLSAANSGPHCAGATLTLNATGAGGMTYAWTGPNTFTSSAEDPTIANAQVVNSGIYTVVYTNTTSGCTASTTTTAVINANPTVSASNSGPHCSGATLTLNATGAGGTAYAWAGPNGFTSAVEDPTIANAQVINSGTYTVVLTNTTSGCTASATTAAIINASPTLSATNSGPHCAGATLTLNATGAGGTVYAWTGPNGFTSSVEDPTIANAQTVNSGTYTVVLTNSTSGCTASTTTTAVINANPTLSASNSGPHCAGATLTLNAIGSGGTSYVWTGPNTFVSALEDPNIANAQVINSGTYTVVLTNTTSGCTASATTAAVINANPTLSASNSGPHCAGVTLSFNSTGVGGTSYAWSGPNGFISAIEDPSIANAQPVNTGTYTVVLTNTTSGCTVSATTDAVINANPTLSATNSGPYCEGQTIAFNATGVGGSDYSWTGPTGFTSAIEDPTRPSSLTTHTGTYTVVLTNSTSGCTASSTTNVVVNTVPVVSASNTGSYCAGQTIVLNATGSGGTAYAWTGPLAFASAVEDPTRVSSLTTHSGNYTVVLTNTTSGCTASATTNVTVNATPTLSATNSGPHCAGTTLTFNASGAGGTMYGWTGPDGFTSSVEDPTIANAQTVNSGTYTVVLTNTTSGCTASATTAAVINANPTLSAANSGPHCASATLTLNASGAGGTNYDWTGPNGFTSTIEDPTIANAQPVATGTYTVVLTNSTSGCTATATTAAVINTNPTVNIGTTINSCPGNTVVLDAGAGYTYEWSTLATTQTINVNAPGTYDVTVTNGNSCTATDDVVVNFYPQTTLAMSSTPESATGANNGTATVTPTGVGPFITIWEGGQLTATITGLTGGNYNVTVTDGNGCTVAGLVNVATNNTPPVANFIANVVALCVGESVTFTDLSSNTPTSWSWNFTGGTPATSNAQNPVIVYNTPGTYLVELTSTNVDGSDIETKAAYITVNANPTVSASNTGAYCVGNTISLNATGAGGTAYAWTGPSGFNSLIEDPTRVNAQLTHAGTYTVVLTNTTSGCTATANTVVAVNANPTISSTNSGPHCAGATLSLDATGAGGTDYDWTGPNGFTSGIEDPAIVNAQVVNSGIYTVVLTNTTSGCTASTTTAAVINANPTVSTLNSGPHCAGATLTLNATGTGGTSYGWTGPNGFISSIEDPTIANAQPINSGIYTVVLTNSTSGCTATATTNAVVNANPTISASNTGPYCAGETLNLNATGAGGTDYSWTGPNTFASAIEDPAIANSQVVNSGTYTVVITNTTSGCTASTTTPVTVYAAPSVSAVNSGPHCDGQTLSLDATGAGATQYDWTGPNGFTSNIEDPIIANAQPANSGLYSVVLTNTTSGCTAIATTNAVVNANPTISASNTGPYCAGETLSLDANGAGGTAYNWTGPDGYTSNIEDPSIVNSQVINSGTYSVILTNTTSGCTATANTAIVVYANPTLSALNSGPHCAGQTLTLNATGVGGTDYSWTGPNGFTSNLEDPTIVNSQLVNSGLYTVVLTNTTSGCTATATTTAVINNNPILSASNTGPYCEGETLILNATGSGGTDYSWTGPDTFTSNVEDPTIINSQFVNSGTYTVVLTNTISGCTASASTATVVNANPTLTVSNSGPHCAGQTLTLNANGAGGTDYSWTGPDGFTSNLEDPTIVNAQVINSGAYAVVLTNSTSGCTASANTTAIVSANPTLSVSNSGPHCEGETLTLDAIGAGGTDYNWTGPDTYTSNVANPSIANALALNSGTYTAVLTNTTSGCTASASTTAVVNANPTLSAANSGPHCEGQTVILNATGVGGTDYAWTGPDGFTSNLEDPTIANTQVVNSGTYTVVITNTTSGCTETTTTDVVINAIPTISATNAGPYCENETLTFDVTGAGGTDYNWTGPDGFTSTLEDPTIANIQMINGGTYTVVLTNTTTSCNSIANTAVLVNANPTVVATNDGSYCEGETINLSANGAGGDSYSWSGPDGYSSMIQNPAIVSASLTNNAMYTVVITNTITGCTATATTTVIVNANPSISASNDGGYCEGSDINLSTVAADGDTFSWTGPNTFVSSDAAPVITGAVIANSGTYSVIYSNSVTGCFATASTIVEVNANPIVNLGANQESCDYNAVTLDAGTGFTSYTWNGTIGTSTYVAPATGTYTIVVEDGNGCTGTDVIDVIINPSHTVEVTTTSESGIGMNDGTASFTAVGGSFPIMWTWSSAQTGNPIIGLAGGVYCVTVEDSNGCTASACGTVNTDNAPPIAAFTADVTEGCAPLTVNFTDESTNFPLTWLWNFDGTNTANTQNASFTFDTPGTYNVSLLVENLDGNNTYQLEINVYANPTPELGDNIIECDGNTVVLDAGDMYVDYLWTGDFDTQTIDVTVGGDYYVTVTTANGCTGTDMVNVYFNPSPVIDLGDDVTICDNEQYTLDAGEGFASYLWNGTIVGQTLVVDAAGTYSIEVTNNFYCPATDEIVISEIPAPFVDLPETMPGCINELFTYTLTDTYESIVWSDATTEQSFSMTWTETGEYIVSVIVHQGVCQDEDAMTVIVDICENIDIVNEESFIGLYPNPTNGLSNLIIKGHTGEISYIVVDAQGKEIIGKTLVVNSEISEEIDIKSLVPGMYFVRVTTETEVTNLKLIRK